MGQKHGKAVYDEAARPFLNLSFAAIGTLWETFNDVADGFGINLHEFREICSELGAELVLNRAQLDKRSTALFKLLDTDNNGLVDAIEFVCTLACTSGMSATETLGFVLGCYDFDGTGRLTIDEITLAFKSTVTGMCKLEGGRNGVCPRDTEFEAAAIDIFESRTGSDKFKVKVLDVIDYCCEQPEIRSWLDFFDDAAEENVVGDAEDAVLDDDGVPGAEDDIDIRQEGCFPERTACETAANEDDTFSFCLSLPEETEAKNRPPWMETVKSLVPSALSGKTIDKSVPDIGASLEWIHGYAGRTSRNNVRYSAGGEVGDYVYIRACVAYNAADHRQRFNLDHTDDISSFAMHPSGRLAATGEVGRAPKIIVWDTATMQTVKVLKGFHQRAVTLLAFSEDGALLASVGQDENHSLAVHDWEKGKVQHTGASDTRVVLGCCFGGDGGVVTCGEGHVLFWKREGRFLVKKMGVFGRQGKAQTLVCCARLQEKIVTGAASGHLYLWLGRNCVRSIRGHYGLVAAIFSGPYGLVSGGKDMRIRLWSPKMEAGATFDMSAFGPCPVVHSACLSSDGTKLLVGVKGCEIYEISAADGSDVAGGPITTSHYEGYLTGLARHPQKAEFATAGGDGTVRIWDSETRSLLRMTKLDTPASSVDYSPDGELLVVGLGARVSAGVKEKTSGSEHRSGGDSGGGKKLKKSRTANSKSAGTSSGGATGSGLLSPADAKAGGFMVLNQADFVTTYEARDAKKAILEARWSPDRDTVVLGCEDSSLYLYSTGENFDLIATAVKHKHPVTSVDFSKDGDWIRSNCEGGHLHIWDSNKGKHQSNIIKYKDVEWSTETCTFAWPTRGLFSGRADGTHITCTDRSLNGLVVAAGDGFSRVRLYRHPCPSDCPPSALFHELRGHGAGGISRARFLKGGNVLVTVGDSDRCVMQWVLSGAGVGEVSSAGKLKDTAEAVAEEESEGYILDLRDGSDLERGSDFEAAADERRAPTFGGAGKKKNDFGDRDAATMPIPPQLWEESTVAPTRLPPTDKSSPADGLELERIHGYRGRDVRSNAAYAGSDGNKAVYTTAAAGVSLDLVNYTQQFQLGHSGDTACLAVSPDGLLIATGEVSRRPNVIVWRAESAEAVKTLSGFHKRAVTTLSFSPDGRHLASIGCDDNHSIAVYDWKNILLRATAKGGRRKALCVAWNGLGTRLVSCGLRHINFWTFAGRNLNHCRGVLGNNGRKQTMPCCAFVGDTAVVGAGDGHLYVFEEGSTTLTRTVKAHTGSVYTLHPVGGPGGLTSDAPGGIWSGGKDGLVKHYDQQMHSLKEFSVATIASNGAPGGAAGALKALAATAKSGGPMTPGKRRPGTGGTNVSLDPAVRSVFASTDRRRLLIGTRGGELYEMSTADGSDANGGGDGGRDKGTGGPLTAGHGKGEVWGLSAHPTQRLYATCGDDGSVRIWSLDDRRVIGSISTDCSCRALCFSPDGGSLAVGCGGGKSKGDASKSGTFLVLKSENLALKHEAKDAEDWIRDVNYSADGARLAVASNDCKIYVYASKDGYSKLSTIASHQSFVTHVDFSVDGNYVQSADGARAMMFADAASGIPIPSKHVYASREVLDPDCGVEWLMNPGQTGASAMRDMVWSTWTLPFGWPVRGIWPTAENDPGTEVECTKRSRDSTLLGAGDNFGRVRLFKYPAPLLGSGCSEYRGHSAAIRRVCWSAGDTHLLSAGADGSVMQWRKVTEPDVLDSGDEAQRSGDDSELEADGGLRCCLAQSQSLGNGDDKTAKVGMQEGSGEREGGGDESGGSKAIGTRKAKLPWVSAMVPPSNMKMSDTTAPDIRTRLEAVHGCRASDIRGCVWYNHEDGIVYPVAALGVIYDPRTGRQAFHQGHLGDVISLTVSRCRRFAASGDAANPPRVHVWDAVTGAIVNGGGTVNDNSGTQRGSGGSGFPSLHRVGVGLLAFSPDGHWLASMGHDPQHTLGVYSSPSGQWGDAFPVATARAGFTRFLCLVFTGQDAFPLLAGGIKAVTLFYHTQGARGLGRKRGIFGFRKKIQPVLCGVKMIGDQTALTGTVSGHLYSWKAHKVERSTPGHAGPVYAIARAGVKGYLTAGKDGFVRLWDEELHKLKQYSIHETSPASTVLHSVCAVGTACKFVVCTRAGEISEISKDSGRVLLLAEGHGKKKLKGLVTHPKDPDIYATVGDDAFVRVWSVSLKRSTGKMRIDSAARALAFSPSGHHLAVGLGGDQDAIVKEGAVIVLSGETLEILEEVRNAKSWISDMKYSDDGHLLAVASSGGLVYVHDATDHYSLKATIAKPEDGSFVENLDFASDGETLQASTSSKDLLFFRTSDGCQVTSKSKSKDFTFQTQTCPAGWTVQAAWPQASPHLEPITVDRSTPSLVEGRRQLGTLLAAGYSTGELLIFRYPCQNQGAQWVSAIGHSTAAGRARFNANGSVLLSIGIDSRVVLQHSVLSLSS